eukprot:Amastigsp_a174539_900.p2 type:complete len:160 gc:universal Amastigsp_a174539_900:497-18(-)
MQNAGRLHVRPVDVADLGGAHLLEDDGVGRHGPRAGNVEHNLDLDAAMRGLDELVKKRDAPLPVRVQVLRAIEEVHVECADPNRMLGMCEHARPSLEGCFLCGEIEALGDRLDDAPVACVVVDGNTLGGCYSGERDDNKGDQQRCGHCVSHGGRSVAAV